MFVGIKEMRYNVVLGEFVLAILVYLVADGVNFVPYFGGYMDRRPLRIATRAL